MKVGIMSMQRIVNYGSFLQAYSLKQIIEELGGTVVFVDYHIGSCLSQNDSKLRRIKLILKDYVLQNQKLRELYFKFRLHQNNVTSCNLKCIFQNELEKLGVIEKKCFIPVLDLLVIGSDEVFNCLQTNPDVGFSLELFGKRHKAKKLISYAASFGNTTLDKLKSYRVENHVKRLLHDFDAISVRDNNSGYIVEELCNKCPEYNLDPVLIGNFDSCIEDKVDEQDYIVVYGYDYRFSDNECIAIRNYATANGKKLVSIGGRQTFCNRHIECPPFEVLAWFKHAYAVITDTFHGSIFSIINHKPFVAVIRDSNNGIYGNREKLEDMLIRLKLTDRILQDINDLAKIMEQKIDYSQQDFIRQEARKITQTYLAKYIN